MNKKVLIASLIFVLVLCVAGWYVTDRKLISSTAKIQVLQNQVSALTEQNNSGGEASGAQAPIQKTDPMVSIGDSDNGKTVSLAVGQKLSVRITEVGSDGGYQFQNPDYDTSLLHLDSHSVSSPSDANSGVVGSSPTGFWNFTVLKKGATDLTITTARAWDPTDHPFQYRVALSIAE